MKLKMRQKLARESFEGKIRRVGQLIQSGEDFSPQRLPTNRRPSSGKMKTTETFPSRRHRTAKQGTAEEETPTKGMETKSKEFLENGADVYAKA